MTWLAGLLVAILLVLIGLRLVTWLIWKNGNWNKD